MKFTQTNNTDVHDFLINILWKISNLGLFIDAQEEYYFFKLKKVFFVIDVMLSKPEWFTLVRLMYCLYLQCHVHVIGYWHWSVLFGFFPYLTWASSTCYTLTNQYYCSEDQGSIAKFYAFVSYIICCQLWCWEDAKVWPLSHQLVCRHRMALKSFLSSIIQWILLASLLKL